MLNQLKRRQFFKQTLAIGAGIATPAFVLAQMQGHGSGAMNHNMGGGHGMMNGGDGMSSCMARLMPTSSLPAGQPLNALWRLPNLSKKAGTYKAKLVAKPAGLELIKGTTTQFWTYQDRVPGPLIEIFEGDALEVEFENQLPQPTTVHWHGITLPADQDGGPMDLVASGTSRFYRFTPPVGSAGTYWFHPHPHYMTAEQVFKGLAGAIIVRAKDDPLASLPEKHLIFSDLKLGADGQIIDNNMMDWMNGREGQFALLNGQRQPVIEVSKPQRWRLWNMNSARYLRLSLAGTPLTVVGTDGGLLGQPQIMQEILLTPGERIELVVDPAVLAKAGAMLELSSEMYDRGKMMGASVSPRLVLAQIKVSATSQKAFTVPQTLRPIQPLGEAVRTRKLELTEVMDMRRMHQGASPNGKLQGMDFFINGKAFDPARVDIEMKRGEVEIWEIYNNSDMDHPMHIHGTQFQVLDRQKQGGARLAEPYLAWKDTVNVKSQETVRIKMVQKTAGDWMYHCHILEHEDLGMMGTLRVT